MEYGSGDEVWTGGSRVAKHHEHGVIIRRLWNLTPSGKLLWTFPQGLENGAPTPFPTGTHSHDDGERASFLLLQEMAHTTSPLGVLCVQQNGVDAKPRRQEPSHTTRCYPQHDGPIPFSARNPEAPEKLNPGRLCSPAMRSKKFRDECFAMVLAIFAFLVVK